MPESLSVEHMSETQGRSKEAGKKKSFQKFYCLKKFQEWEITKTE